jgi:Protein of unknown function (DUF3071)
LSEDGRRVVFRDDSGAEYAAPADDRLRAALRGDRARLGQLEIEMDSALRPRDIQARIRAGASPEAVAAIAQVSVERIMAFCVPVLAERRHIADLARRSHVRRRNVEGPSQQLYDVVVERLTGRGVDPATLAWDAWRREDGRWTVQVTYLSGERERTARFVFDATGRYSLADDDEAKWLTGERQATSKGPQPREAGRPGDRRLSSVPSGGDLLDAPETDEPDDYGDDELTAVVRAIAEPGAEAPSRGSSDEQATQAATPPEQGPDQAGAGVSPEVQAAPEQPADEAPTEQPAGAARTERPAAPRTEPTPERRRRQKRASVPSWDEIMFGKDPDT